MKLVELSQEYESMILEDHRQEYESASPGRQKTLELFNAIKFCGQQELPLPDWTSEAFSRAVSPWLNLDIGSLDEAFCVQPIAAARLGQMREARRIRIQAMFKVREYETAGRPVPWADLAKEFGTSEGTLKRRYYEMSHLKYWEKSEKDS